MKQALDYVWTNNVAMVASVGNASEIVEDIYPATHSHVIGVGSTDFDGMITSFSNYGHDVSVMAPGEGLVTTFPGDWWATVSGTSFSAPMVSAGLALTISYGQSVRAATQTIVNSAGWLDFLNGHRYYNMLGHGLINLDTALWKANTPRGTDATTSTAPKKEKGKKN